MSGKKSRNLRKLNSLSKKAIVPIAAGLFSFLPVKLESETIFSVFPHYLQPISVGAEHGILNGIGAGARITYRPIQQINLFAQGDYLSLALPKVDPISVLNGSIGMGYHIQINDRFSFNANMSVGAYKGKYKGSMTAVSGGFSLGFEYKINPVVSTEFNASLSHFNAGDTSLVTGAQVSPGISLNITNLLNRKSKLKVETKQLYPVFPVLYSWYEHNAFGTISIENNEDCTIENISVKFYQPQYMSQPNECAKLDSMKKGEIQDVDLTAFFNERMLDLLEMTDTQSFVTIEYECLGMKKTQEYAMKVPVCGRNSMSWDDDRRAAVFVSSKDPAAMWYSKRISSIVRENMRNGVPESIQYAMGIYDTLESFGINYVIDPTSAYADNVGTASVDFLQFPYQTLMYRGGDCDDLSILTCSLLEAVGIHSAFITIPGHIFIAFDSGLTYNEAKYVFSENDYFINHEGEAWVPLEITLTNEGFAKAWRTGAREWQTAYAQGTAAIYPMHDSWKIYKPVSVPGAAIKFSMLEDDIVEKIYSHSINNWIEKEISDQVKYYLAKIQKDGKIDNSKLEDINQLGILYGRFGIFNKAEEYLKIARRKNYLPAILNTANVYYSMKEYKIAKQWYEQFLKIQPDNAIALLGVAKCAYEIEDYESCDEAFSKVVKISPTLTSMNTYLGAFENNEGRAFSLAQRTAKTIWVDNVAKLNLYQENKNNSDFDKNLFDLEDFELHYSQSELAKNDGSDNSIDEEFMINEELIINDDESSEIASNQKQQEKSQEKKDDLLKKNPEAVIAKAEIETKENSESEEKDKTSGGDGDDNGHDDNAHEDALAFLEELPDGVLSTDEMIDEVTVAKDDELDEKERMRIASLMSFEDEDDFSGEYDVDMLIGLQNQISIAETSFIEDAIFDVAKVEEEIVEPVEIAETFDLEELKEEEQQSEIAIAIASKASEFEKRQAAALISGVEKEVAIAEETEPEQETIVFREVPRYTRTAASEWASEESYKAEIIPGMKSYEEEMGISNEKAYLTEELNAFVKTPDADFDEIIKPKATSEQKEEIVKENEISEENQEIIEPEVFDEKIEENEIETEITETATKSSESENVELSDSEKKIETVKKAASESKKTKGKNEKHRRLISKALEAFDEETAEPEEPETVEKSVEKTIIDDSTLQKKDFNWLLWLFAGCGLLGFFFIFIILWKRREDEDEEEKKKNESKNENKSEDKK